jgi:hypothetical protein
MQLALYINDNLTKPPEIIKKNLNNRLARNGLHGARRELQTKCRLQESQVRERERDVRVSIKRLFRGWGRDGDDKKVFVQTNVKRS